MHGGSCAQVQQRPADQDRHSPALLIAAIAARASRANSPAE